MRLIDFQRLIDIVKRKIYLLIGRAILTAVNNDEKTQKVQVTCLKDETITDIERMQEYGFETYPGTDTEAVVLFQNGNRDQGLVICIHDKENRPTDLSSGEVRVYDSVGSKITLKSGGIIEIEGNSGSTLEQTVLGETLKGLLEQILDAIVILTVPTPAGPSGPPVNAATFTTIKSQLATALSQGVKIN